MSCASSPMGTAVCGWCGPSQWRPTRTGSSSIATSTWTICASTRRRRCAVRPDPRPVQPGTVLARSRTLRAGSSGAADWTGGILDCRCARRSARRQVGTKGWSFPIEQRDIAIDLKTHQHPLYMINLLNLTHTTANQLEQRQRLDLSTCDATHGD